jgi:hypothetical protein
MNCRHLGGWLWASGSVHRIVRRITPLSDLFDVCFFGQRPAFFERPFMEPSEKGPLGGDY